jgi:hypothetical protein
MRCYFIKGGDVDGVEELLVVTQSEAIELARTLFEKRKWELEGFEVWDDDRLLYEFPDPVKKSA